MGGVVGRNDKCPCGSGKKYKKCCLNGIQQAQSKTLSLHRVTDKNKIRDAIYKYGMDDTFRDAKTGTRGSEILYMPSYEKLDDDIKDLGLEPIVPKLEKLMETSPFPVWTNCHSNAHAISLFEGMDNIIPVAGWYGTYDENMVVPRTAKVLGNPDDGRFWDEDQAILYDTMTNIDWAKHTWNVAIGRSKKYGDVHFDLGTETFKPILQPDNPSFRWFYYKETYRPENYYNNPDYLDLVKDNKDVKKLWWEFCKRTAFRFALEGKDSTNSKMPRTKYWNYGKQKDQQELWKDIMESYRETIFMDYPVLKTLVNSSVELQSQLDDLCLEYFLFETFKTQDSSQTKLLSKWLPNNRWDIYNPNHLYHSEWKEKQ